MFLFRNMHTKCRNEIYPLSNIKRLTIPDKLVPWFVDYQNYNPPDYESPVLHNKPWADPPISTAVISHPHSFCALTPGFQLIQTSIPNGMLLMVKLIDKVIRVNTK